MARAGQIDPMPQPIAMNTPHIVGWGHTPFGKLDTLDLEQLLRDAALPAMASAGLEPSDIDGIFIGHFNAGFVRQDFSGAMAAVAIPEFRHTPAVRMENACATGSAAIWAALDALASGRVVRALVVGMEKMNTLPNAQIGATLLKCSYVKEEGDTPGGFAGVFGSIAQQYFERFGDQSDALAAISAKNHGNGVANPFAHMRRDLGFEFCRDPTRFEGAALAWGRSLVQARVSLTDLHFVETHDCFTIAEWLEYEAMGLAPHGRGARVILDGVSRKGGKLPVNPSGGLKSRGHPIGATGVSQQVMAAMQLSGTAGAMQVEGARLGAVFNMGGAAVANYLSVLEAA